MTRMPKYLQTDFLNRFDRDFLLFFFSTFHQVLQNLLCEVDSDRILCQRREGSELGQPSFKFTHIGSDMSGDKKWQHRVAGGFFFNCAFFWRMATRVSRSGGWMSAMSPTLEAVAQAALRVRQSRWEIYLT